MGIPITIQEVLADGFSPVFIKVWYPRERAWIGYRELSGLRQRFRILDLDRLLRLLGDPDLSQFRRYYESSIQEQLAKDQENPAAPRAFVVAPQGVGGSVHFKAARAGGTGRPGNLWAR
jgi:hypothetical protein